MNWSPKTERELVDMIRSARADKIALEVVGHGTKRGLGRPCEASAVVDLSQLSGIIRYEPDELVITARAGTSIDEIEETIAGNHHRLGFEPANWSMLYGPSRDGGTIGGALSADACGSARVRFGGARDHLLGFRGVNGFGEAYKAGGRVVKNVSGFDLPKLVCGAMGTLGVLTEVTLRLVPRARHTATLMVRNADAETGLLLLRRIWSSPLEATGLAYVPQIATAAFPELGEVGNGAALVRLDGGASALLDKVRAADQFLKPHEVISCDDGNTLFGRIGSGSAFVERGAVLLRIFVAPAQAPQCAREMSSPFWLADWAGGVIWALSEDPAAIAAVAGSFGGHAQLMHADTATRQALDLMSPVSPALKALTERVKLSFDPLRLFNFSRMFDGI